MIKGLSIYESRARVFKRSGWKSLYRPTPKHNIWRTTRPTPSAPFYRHMKKSKRLDVIGSKSSSVQLTDERTDGLGNLLIEAAEYYIQDCRTYVGNCALWWGIDSKGYTCNLDEAGVYSGKEALHKRGTDVPWPVDYIRSAAVRHVRADGSVMDRSKYKPGKY